MVILARWRPAELDHALHESGNQITNVMYYIYALVSLKNNDVYIGYSSDLRRRFKEHNLGQVSSTKSNRPWKIVYYEAYENEKYARRQEKRLKMHAAKKELKMRLGLG